MNLEEIISLVSFLSFCSPYSSTSQNGLYLFLLNPVFKLLMKTTIKFIDVDGWERQICYLLRAFIRKLNLFNTPSNYAIEIEASLIMELIHLNRDSCPASHSTSYSNFLSWLPRLLLALVLFRKQETILRKSVSGDFLKETF